MAEKQGGGVSSENEFKWVVRSGSFIAGQRSMESSDDGDQNQELPSAMAAF